MTTSQNSNLATSTVLDPSSSSYYYSSVSSVFVFILLIFRIFIFLLRILLLLLPLDYQAPPSSDFHLGNIEREFGTEEYPLYPDRELLSMLRYGAMFKTDMELTIVLGPHLTSLGEAADSFSSVEAFLRQLPSFLLSSLF